MKAHCWHFDQASRLGKKLSSFHDTCCWCGKGKGSVRKSRLAKGHGPHFEAHEMVVVEEVDAGPCVERPARGTKKRASS